MQRVPRPPADFPPVVSVYPPGRKRSPSGLRADWLAQVWTGTFLTGPVSWRLDEDGWIQRCDHWQNKDGRRISTMETDHPDTSAAILFSMSLGLYAIIIRGWSLCVKTWRSRVQLQMMTFHPVFTPSNQKNERTSVWCRTEGVSPKQQHSRRHVGAPPSGYQLPMGLEISVLLVHLPGTNLHQFFKKVINYYITTHFKLKCFKHFTIWIFQILSYSLKHITKLGCFIETKKKYFTLWV